MARKASVSMKVQGVDRLRRKLERIAGEVTAKNELLDALSKGAEPVFRAADAKVPVRFGGLRDSIEIQEVEDARYGAAVAVVADSPLAHLQEFGTVHHGATPFLRPAFDEEKAAVMRIVRREMEDAVQRAAR